MSAEQDVVSLAHEIQEQMESGDVPTLEIPARYKTNMVLDDELDAWVYGDREIERTGKTIEGATKLLKMVYTLNFIKDQLDQGQSSTLRELYYVSESWDFDPAQFADQDDSNGIVSELEILTGRPREEFELHPEESGGKVIGPLEIREDNKMGTRDIHCVNEVGTAGYGIPNHAEKVEFLDCDAEFVIAVETSGMRERLVNEGFYEDYNCLIVHTAGQPARSTRRIIKRMNDELDLPVAVFCDCDPWSYRIFGSIAYGSIQSAHLAERLVTPEAKYLGVRPSDIRDYDLPTDPLSDGDINALEAELDDPRFQTENWSDEIEMQLEMGEKCEQQSLAKHGLTFVTETYLPERLDEMGLI